MKKNNLDNIKAKKQRIEKKLEVETNRYIALKKEYEKQEKQLDKVMERLKNAANQNDATLKIIIQKIMDKLDIELISIGKKDISEEESSSQYSKFYFPYEIKGKGYNIARFFHYLENSNLLLTLKGGSLEINSISDEEEVNVRFRLGIYSIEDKTLKNSESANKLENKEESRDSDSLIKYIRSDVYLEGIKRFGNKDTDLFIPQIEKINVTENNIIDKIILITKINGRWSGSFYYTNYGKSYRKTIISGERMEIQGTMYYIEPNRSGFILTHLDTGKVIKISNKSRWGNE